MPPEFLGTALKSRRRREGYLASSPGCESICHSAGRPLIRGVIKAAPTRPSAARFTKAILPQQSAFRWENIERLPASGLWLRTNRQRPSVPQRSKMRGMRIEHRIRQTDCRRNGSEPLDHPGAGRAARHWGRDLRPGRPLPGREPMTGQGDADRTGPHSKDRGMS